jgi:DNA-binding transcriptional MerR regulator
MAQRQALGFTLNKAKSMVKYEREAHQCRQCRAHVPFTFGQKELCGACYRTYYGNTKALSAMEQKILEQEQEIVDLQTIINLMQDMSNKISEHNAVIANKE